MMVPVYSQDDLTCTFYHCDSESNSPVCVYPIAIRPKQSPSNQKVCLKASEVEGIDQGKENVSHTSVHSCDMPQSHDFYSNKSHDYSSSKSHGYSLSKSHGYSPTKSRDYSSPRSHDYSSRRSYDYSSPRSHDYSSRRSHDYSSSRSHDYSSPRSHDYSATKSHDYSSQSIPIPPRPPPPEVEGTECNELVFTESPGDRFRHYDELDSNVPTESVSLSALAADSISQLRANDQASAGLSAAYTVSSNSNFTCYTPSTWNSSCTSSSGPPPQPSPQSSIRSYLPHQNWEFSPQETPKSPMLDNTQQPKMSADAIPLPGHSLDTPLPSWRQRRPITFGVKYAKSPSTLHSPLFKYQRLSPDIKNKAKGARSPRTKQSITASDDGAVATDTPVKRSKPGRWSLPTSCRTPLYIPDSLNSRDDSSLSFPKDSEWMSRYRAKHMISQVPYIDSHCHLDYLFTRKRHTGSLHTYLHCTDPATTHTVPSNFAGCLAVFCDPSSWKFERRWKALLSEDNVWGSFGVHPKLAEQWNVETEASLRLALKHPKVRALGEIGLDYSKGLDSFKYKQKEAFRRQLSLALEFHLPLVIHCRDAEEDCWVIMTEMLPADYKIHRHCFTNSWHWARRWLLHFPSLMIGLTPLVTFPNAHHTHQVAKLVPLDKLLLETDAPYFIPHGVPREEMAHTHPAMAITVAAEVAALRDVSIDDVLRATRRNTKAMYDI